MPITATQLKNALPRCPDPVLWVPALNAAFAKYDINSNMRIAAFLAQVGQECGQMTNLIESLNYSTPGRLMAVWPKRFPTEAFATQYVRDDKKLGNYVYANRNGNGDPASGDGFNYRGRGLIQITGRTNYAAVGTALGIDAIGNPALLLQPAYAALSAAWFWAGRGLNALADDKTDDNDLEDFTRITVIINGGKTDIQARLALYKQVEAQLSLVA